MAEVKNYGLSGVHRNLQLGKQGPQLSNNGDDTISVKAVSGELTAIAGANASQSNHFVTKAQLDSLASDTLTANVDYNSGTVTLGTVQQSSRPVSVILEVTDAFDGNTIITVGDDADPDRLMSSPYMDLSEEATFVTNPSHVYAADTDIKVYVTQGNSTVGSATVLVSYS